MSARSLRRSRGAGLAALLLALSGCACQAQPANPPGSSTASGSGGGTVSPTATGSPGPTRTPAPSTSPTDSTPRAAPSSAAPSTTPVKPPTGLASLTLRQRLGQLFLVSAKADGSNLGATAAALQSGVGNFYLNGRTSGGVDATASVVAQLRAAVQSSQRVIPPAVATDQEGGQVQVLRGPGFSAIPSALQQGQWAPADLRAAARQWGSELRSAGMTLDLAPVLDVVPSADFAPQNIPIGHYQRNYGFDPATVAASGNAFAQGLSAAGVAPVVKHFPGLGRVTANTDVTTDVHDTVTTRTDPYLQPFRQAVQSGVRWVMLSNAYYDRIDPGRMAPLSPVVIQGMLRQDLGFRGAVVSDDLCEAKQLSSLSAADRAVGFFSAGGSLLVCANSWMASSMLDAVVAKAESDPVFRAKAEAAAQLVVRTKNGS